MMEKTTSGFSGFTLIEISIVLVIIGLVIGGILVGQDLIAAATVRSQVTQIEKFNQAVNTFRGKYGGYLPGDIPDPYASQFGFAARGTNPGEGDGNGLIQGYQGWYGSSTASNQRPGNGEAATFWVDLSTAGLIEGGFNSVTPITYPSPSYTGAQIGLLYPAAKIAGNYIYIWPNGLTGNDGNNYYGLSPVCLTNGYINGGSCMIDSVSGDSPPSSPYTMTVAQAYSIDKKIDDGFPRTGNVFAYFLNAGGTQWANPYAKSNWSDLSGASNTCADNAGGSGTFVYSMEIAQGINPNCALSFKFQ